MNVLVIGGGGREHALAWKIAQSPRVAKVFVAPGNAGTAVEPALVNVAVTTIADLVALAQAEQIALTIVGPEAPRATGFRRPRIDRSPLPKKRTRTSRNAVRRSL